MKCLQINACSLSDTFYKDTLRISYGIGNVRLSFKDMLAFYMKQNENLIQKHKRFNITPFKVAKTIDVRKQRLMGYELYTY